MRPTVLKRVKHAVLILASLFLFACSGGDDGAAGPAGPPGTQGPPGPPAPPPDTTSGIGDGSELTSVEIETFGKLQATITNVTVSSPPQVEITVLDKNGNPALGLAEGTVRATFAKLVPGSADINGGLPYWQSYINRVSEGDEPDAVLTQAIQATNDRDGTLEEIGNGQYVYTFAADVTAITDPIPVVWEPNLTHRVALEIRLDRDSGARRAMAPNNPFLDFVPAGGAGSGVSKNIADTNNCNACHFEFAEHGGQRKTVEYCVTCHNPGSVDPNSGQSVDMAYMAHSIHMGNDRAVPYIVDGDDFSVVHFPQSKTYCESCHAASETHLDGNAWNEGASPGACGGCHADGLITQNFDAVTGQAEYLFDHAVADVNLGLVEDGEQCTTCHTGAVQYAGPSLDIHRAIRGDARARAEAGDNFNFEILGATNTGPGETPIITFRISNKDNVAYNILTAPEFDLATEDVNGRNPAALNLYVQWSTDDFYGGDENGLVLGGRKNNSLTESGVQDLSFEEPGYAYRMYLGAIQDAIINGGGSSNADGSFTVPYFRALPQNFTGDIAVGLGGHPAWESTDANGITGYDRAAAISTVFYPGTEREVAFDSAKCNNCHQRLQFHGSNRNGDLEICLLCHNADTAVCSDDVDPANGSCAVGELDSNGETIFDEGYHFGYMIHSIHSASPTFIEGEFSEVRYPQNIANCNACHIEGRYDVARDTARSVSTSLGDDIRVWTDDIATTPTAAACGTCHTSNAALAHFETQGAQVEQLKCTIVGAGCGAPDGSTGTGLPNGQEACAVCHDSGSQFESSQYHNPGL
jgi:OmcA/MtrC family decaheme c-type cytochrome